MVIQTVIAGHFGGRAVEAEGQVELKQGAELKTVFKKADAALGLKRPKAFKAALKTTPPAVILLNGAKVELPSGLKTPLKDGDRVSVLVPVGGG